MRNEDTLRDSYDRPISRDNPHSPYYEPERPEPDPDRQMEEMRDFEEAERE